jgi:hypothetical protein
LLDPPSKKSQAHKNIGTSSKAGAGLQPVRAVAAPRPLLKPNAQGSSLAPAAGEGLLEPKRKSGRDAFAVEPSTKKGRVDKARELLWTIALVRFDVVSASYRPPGDLGDACPSDGVVPLDGCSAGGEGGPKCGW